MPKAILLVESIKKDIVEFMAKYLSFQQVKYENQRLSGMMQRMTIPEWKC